MAKLNNNVTAPIEDDKPKKSALQILLDAVVIKSRSLITAIFDGTAEEDEKVIDYFRSPFVYLGKGKDNRQLVKTPKLAESVYGVYVVMPTVLPKLNEEGEIVEGEFIPQTDAMRLVSAIETQSKTFRLEARKGGTKVDLHNAVDIAEIRNVIATAVNNLSKDDVRKDKNDVGFHSAEGETKQIGSFVKITGKPKDLQFSFEIVQKTAEVDPKEVEPAEKEDKTQDVVTK